MEPHSEIYNHDEVSNNHFFANLISGGVAGGLGVAVGVPFDIVKVRMQTFSHMYKSSLQCFRKLLAEEGIRGVYNGSLAPILSLVPTNALIFAGEDAARRLLEKSNNSYISTDSILGGFLCGSFGGLCQLVALVPGDVVKCKMQVDSVNIGSGVAPKYNGIFDAVRQIYRHEGLLSFYNGTVATACRELPSIGTYFTVYNNFKSYFTPKGQDTPTWVTLVGGGIAGSASWGVVYPFDVIKTNIQIAVGKPLGTFATGRLLVSKYGIRGLFNGMGPTVLRAFPVNAITFYFLELFKSWLHL